MNRRFRQDNPFWLSLQGQLDGQINAVPMPEPLDAKPLVEPDAAEVKRTRLEIERIKRRNLEHAA